MSHYRCVIQASSNADHRGPDLEQRLAAHHAKHYPGERPDFAWIRIPPGRMFTEGVQSTSSIVSAFVDHKTDFGGREAYLRGVCDIWTDVTGCTDHEVVATITEPTEASNEE